MSTGDIFLVVAIFFFMAAGIYNSYRLRCEEAALQQLQAEIDRLEREMARLREMEII